MVSFRETLDSMMSAAHIKIESVAPAVSYVANGSIFAWGALTFNQVMMLIGTLFAVATYFTSLYFQRRKDRREQEFHQHRIMLENQAREQRYQEDRS